jgi:hypothetical protein
MTSQTKKFIELSDIVGLRLECKTCGCALLIEISRTDGTLENLLAKTNSVLSQCPTCGSQWTSAPTGLLAFDSEVKELFRQMRDLKKIEAKFGCLLTLEIKGEPEQSASKK